jgi:Sulfotransferase domain
MGQGASKPGPPTTQMQVLGLGQSRTGTASFARAMEILLHGPAYHSGANILQRGNAHMLRWIAILRTSARLRQNPAAVPVTERIYQKYLLAQQLEGFVAVADAPCVLYAELLMELYPAAKIIVTTRDETKWWRSIAPVYQAGRKKSYTSLLLFWVPGLRHWAEYVDLHGQGRWADLYYTKGERAPGPHCYSRHYEYLERVVPKDKLHYYDVKTGWGPLCKILDLPVPDVEFPFENDALVIQAAFTKAAYLGMGLWAAFFALAMSLIVGTLYANQRGWIPSSLIARKS